MAVVDRSFGSNRQFRHTEREMLALQRLGALIRLAERNLKTQNLPAAIHSSTLALADASTLKVFTNVAYRLLWVRGLAWYGCKDRELALQDLCAAVDYAPPAKRALALRCLCQVQQRLDNQQFCASITLPGFSEDDNASTCTLLSAKRHALCAEVSSTATALPRHKRARTCM